MSTSDETRIEAALEQLEKDDLQALILPMVQEHPELAGLIVSGEQKAVKKPHKPFNAEVYRMQVEKIFLTTDRDRWGSEARAADPLLDIVDVADEYVEQRDFNEAATVYEIVIKGILDNYDSFRWHADEGQLDDVVEACVEGLSDCLRGMQQETAARKNILKTLFDVYDLDMSLENDMLTCASSGVGGTIIVLRASISSTSAGSTSRWVKATSGQSILQTSANGMLICRR